MNRRLLLLTALTVVAACRPDPGQPSYDSPDGWDPTTEDPDFVQSEDPYEDGDDRLSLGIFYEGGFSETLPIDNDTRHYYIYENSYSQTLSDDRTEGLSSDEISPTGAQVWWGGGVTWDTPTDLSEWTTMHISFASADASFATFDVGMGDGNVEARVNVADRGFVNDGAWTSLSIPLTDFEGLNLEGVTLPLLLASGAGTAGETLRVDDFYFTKD